MLTFESQKHSDIKAGRRDLLGRGLDPGLVPLIRAINMNPNVRTIGSCSGHDGHPSLQFQCSTTPLANYYTQQLRSRGIQAAVLMNTKIPTVSAELPNTTTGAALRSKSPIWVKYNREHPEQRLATPVESRSFWQIVLAVLTSKPTSSRGRWW